MYAPFAVYVDDGSCGQGRSVSVQWERCGGFLTLHEDGTVTEQFREPSGYRIAGSDHEADTDESSVA